MIDSINNRLKNDDELLEAAQVSIQAEESAEVAATEKTDEAQFQSTIAKAEVKPLEPWDLYGSKDRADKGITAALKKFDELCNDETVSFRELMLQIHVIRARGAAFNKRVKNEGTINASIGNESALENMKKEQERKGSIISEFAGECIKIGAQSFVPKGAREARFALTALGSGGSAFAKVLAGQQQVNVQTWQGRVSTLTARETADRQADSQNAEGSQTNQAAQQYLQADHDAMSKAIGQ